MSDLNYAEASKHLSPGMREFLLRVASRSGIAEDDALYAVIAAHGDMLDEKLKTIHGQLEKALNGSRNDQVSHSEDVEAPRAEITQLTLIVRGVGESLSKCERRFQIVGDTLSKFEQRTADVEKRLASLDETAEILRKVATSNVWQLIGVSALSGALLTFALHLFTGWF